MPWTAPEVPRPAVPRVASQRRHHARGMVYLHRQTLLMKCAGLQRRAAQAAQRRTLYPDLARPGPAYGGGGARLVPDLLLLGRPSATCTAPRRGLPPTSTTSSPRTRPPNFATFAEEVRLARAVTVGRALDDTFVHPQRNIEINLRWVYVHMIEEYARHNGHADRLRERIDEVTGARWSGG